MKLEELKELLELNKKLYLSVNATTEHYLNAAYSAVWIGCAVCVQKLTSGGVSNEVRGRLLGIFNNLLSLITLMGKEDLLPELLEVEEQIRTELQKSETGMLELQRFENLARSALNHDFVGMWTFFFVACCGPSAKLSSGELYRLSCTISTAWIFVSERGDSYVDAWVNDKNLDQHMNEIADMMKDYSGDQFCEAVRVALEARYVGGDK